MFNFMKKEKSDEEKALKEKRKNEKKEKRDSKSEKLTNDDLQRLEEVRRSLKLKGGKSKKEKYNVNDIKSDYSDASYILASHSIPEGSTLSPSDSDSASTWSKEGSISSQDKGIKSILKTKAVSISASSSQMDLDDTNLLFKNTQQNEYVNVYDLKKERVNIREDKNRILGDLNNDNHRLDTHYEVDNNEPFGESTGSNSKNLVKYEIPIPEFNEEILSSIREVELDRNANGYFNISLHNSKQYYTNGSSRTNIIVVESHVSEYCNVIGLLPSDQLIEVNGTNVVGKKKEEVSSIISNSGSKLVLQVSPVPEMLEITSKKLALKGKQLKGNDRFLSNKYTQARSEDELSSEKAWLEAEKVWLVHRDGFTSGHQIKEDGSSELSDEGSVKVKLDYNDEVIEVDEDDIEKANPPLFDKVEDLAQLRFINESSALFTLQQRYMNNLIHTYAGPTIISINPCSPLAIYSQNIIDMFHGCKLEDIPPHIYSGAQAAYQNMVSTKKDQSIAFIGRSGSGKTTNFRHVLNYLVSSAGCNTNVLTAEKLHAVNILLESFGNTRTVMNANATRFTEIFSVDFDHSGVIVSASLQAFLLEKSRVCRRPEGEPNFNIFYQLLAGLDSQSSKEFLLENLSEPNAFMTPLQRSEDKINAAAAFKKLNHAAEVLNITNTEMKALWGVLVAIYHLGSAGVGKSNLGRITFSKPQAAQKAAQVLGISIEDLTQAIFQKASNSNSSNTQINGVVESSVELEMLQGFAVGLYSQTFNVLLSLINRSLSSTTAPAASIIVVDSPGFQNPATCGRVTGATFEDLCHNYGQERLQMMFHSKTITALKDQYESEQIEVADLEDLTEICTPLPLIHLIDKQSMARVSQADLSKIDKRGLLWLLDEEAIFPGATDESFVERLLLQYGDRDNINMIKKGHGELNFILQHFQGTNPVLYNAKDWLKTSRESTSFKTASQLIQESSHKTISDLFLKHCSVINTTIGGSIAGMEGSQSLRRASSVRRFVSGTAGIKTQSIALQVKFQIDGMVEQLRRTRVKFVHCFLPQHTAGLCDVKSPSGQQLQQTSMNIPLLRSQLRGSNILESIRLHKIGFPESLGYEEFARQFSILGGSDSILEPGKGKAEVEKLLNTLDLDKSSYRLGNTQVFFRNGVLVHLEEERCNKIEPNITKLQACCRAYLSRKRTERLKTQVLAIKCIQKNVRKFIGVRDWPWWRLLIKVTPMINVHRTEEQLKAREVEVEQLRTKLEKAEKERYEFKEVVEKQEIRLGNMAIDLSEEHSASVLAAERLESEQTNRLKLEKENIDLVNENRHIINHNERLEVEVLHSRALDIKGNEESDEDEASGSIYKVKYERALQEIEYLKKRMNQQHEDDQEQLNLSKRQLEKKVKEAYVENDEQRQVVAQWKRKAQKLQGEMNDIRLHLEEQSARNNLLEKKQRKFDSEVNLINEDKRQEMVAKEKYQNEVDQLRLDKVRLEDQINGLIMDSDFKDEKMSSLKHELDELNSGEIHTGDEFKELKKSNQEMDMKLKDQEEELDDMAGQVQMLEANKIKLEMEMAQLRREYKQEVQSREDELEDARTSANRKSKLLEQQLEQDHEEKLVFVKERHEYENKISNLQELLESVGDENTIAKLKKDLKRTKVLLKDSHVMIEKLQSEGNSKLLVRQLKTQLEDAEFAKTAAMKARQNANLELTDVQIQLDDISHAKKELEERHHHMSREKADLASQLQENEDELHDVMRKYKASVAAVSTDQITLQDQAATIQELEEERNRLKEQMAELIQKVESMDKNNDSNMQHKRLEMKIRELESKLELEMTMKGRFETKISRFKETTEKLNKELDDMKLRDQSTNEQQRKTASQLRNLKENYASSLGKEAELIQKNEIMEKQLDLASVEKNTTKSDLKLAMKRIEDLQSAISGTIDSESDIADYQESSDDESYLMDPRERIISSKSDVNEDNIERLIESEDESVV